MGSLMWFDSTRVSGGVVSLGLQPCSDGGIGCMATVSVQLGSSGSLTAGGMGRKRLLKIK